MNKFTEFKDKFQYYILENIQYECLFPIFESECNNIIIKHRSVGQSTTFDFSKLKIIKSFHSPINNLVLYSDITIYFQEQQISALRLQ